MIKNLASTLIWSVLCATCVIDHIHGAALTGLAVHNEGLTYLGLYHNPTGTMSASPEKREAVPTSQQTSYYFLSQNSASFYMSERDCKDYLGEDATLLFIETKEELKAVTKFLANSDDTGASYWVGCKYDVSKKNFVWGNGAELGPWSETIWDVGHPDTRTHITRVSIHTQAVRGFGGLKLRTQLQTVSNRYICELKVGNPEEEALPCYKDNDLIVIVDSSKNIGKSSYTVVLEFITRLAIAWADNTDSRFSVVLTSGNGQSLFSLNDTLSVSEFRDNFFKAPQLGGAPGISEGIGKAIEEFEKYDRNVAKNVVILTGSNIDDTAELNSIRLQGAGVNTFSVGVGSDAGKTGLALATGNKADRVFFAEGYDTLLKNLQGLSRKICSVDAAERIVHEKS